MMLTRSPEDAKDGDTGTHSCSCQCRNVVNLFDKVVLYRTFFFFIFALTQIASVIPAT